MERHRHQQIYIHSLHVLPESLHHCFIRQCESVSKTICSVIRGFLYFVIYTRWYLISYVQRNIFLLFSIFITSSLASLFYNILNWGDRIDVKVSPYGEDFNHIIQTITKIMYLNLISKITLFPD